MKADPRQFEEYETILAARFPSEIAVARRLADSVIDPTRADAESVWSVLWDKPLFANARVPVAERWCDTLRPHMEGAWRRWGQPEHFLINKTGPGTRRSSFTATGPDAEEILQTGIALHRLYAAQGAAAATRTRAARSEMPFADLARMDLSQAVWQLRHEFRDGWGPITALHFLTDLGLAAKPDLHLMRAMRHLSGIVPPVGNRVPGFDEAIVANHAVRQLLADLGRDPTPANIRYLDKVLMEISRQGIIQPAPVGD